VNITSHVKNLFCYSIPEINLPIIQVYIVLLVDENKTPEVHLQININGNELGNSRFTNKSVCLFLIKSKTTKITLYTK
jgi:hypothetical protein